MKNGSDNKIVELFRHGNVSAKLVEVTDSFKMKRGGQL